MRTPDEISSVLQRLEVLEGPDAELDHEIMLILGFEQAVIDRVIRATPVKRMVWISPNGGEPLYELRCTSSMEDAFLLMKAVAPGLAGGVSWESGMASAKLGQSKAWQARTPQAALCMAIIDAAVSPKAEVGGITSRSL
jgi:hypothetical protein